MQHGQTYTTAAGSTNKIEAPLLVMVVVVVVVLIVVYKQHIQKQQQPTA
jgi:hypothetical protein